MKAKRGKIIKADRIRRDSKPVVVPADKPEGEGDWNEDGTMEVLSVKGPDGRVERIKVECECGNKVNIQCVMEEENENA